MCPGCFGEPSSAELTAKLKPKPPPSPSHIHLLYVYKRENERDTVRRFLRLYCVGERRGGGRSFRCFSFLFPQAFSARNPFCQYSQGKCRSFELRPFFGRRKSLLLLLPPPSSKKEKFFRRRREFEEKEEGIFAWHFLPFFQLWGNFTLSRRPNGDVFVSTHNVKSASWSGRQKLNCFSMEVK